MEVRKLVGSSVFGNATKKAASGGERGTDGLPTGSIPVLLRRSLLPGEAIASAPPAAIPSARARRSRTARLVIRCGAQGA
jgi:hypothetical protein